MMIGRCSLCQRLANIYFFIRIFFMENYQYIDNQYFFITIFIIVTSICNSTYSTNAFDFRSYKNLQNILAVIRNIKISTSCRKQLDNSLYNYLLPVQ